MLTFGALALDPKTRIKDFLPDHRPRLTVIDGGLSSRTEDFCPDVRQIASGKTYGYAGGNPLSFSDPTGLDSGWCLVWDPNCETGADWFVSNPVGQALNGFAVGATGGIAAAVENQTPNGSANLAVDECNPAFYGAAGVGAATTVLLTDGLGAGAADTDTYVLDVAKQSRHVSPTNLPGKSVFYPGVDVTQAAYDAATYADKNDLWMDAGGGSFKAKVSVTNSNVGVNGIGEPTNWINVYRSPSGKIHISPGNPPS